MKAIVHFGLYALAAGILIFLLSSSRVVVGDSITVVRGVQVLRRSLVDWKVPAGPTVLSSSEASALVVQGKALGRGVGHFPLYQYVVGLLLSLLGAGEETLLDLFCLLSALSFLGCLAIFRGALRGRSPAAAAAMLVLLTGPLLWYARCSFGEMLAAFLILAYAAACVCGAAPRTIAVLFVAAGLTKETALPFLLLIAAVPMLEARRAGRGRLAGQAKAVAWAALIAVTLTAGFNYYRFDTLHNAVNFQEWMRVPERRIQAMFFAALWLSPNGGLLFFWPSFAAVLAGLAVVLLRTPRRSRPSLIPVIGVGLLLLGLTLGFSKWYAPFGWPAWGPRLMLPWIPAAVLMLFYYYPQQVQSALAWLCARPIRGWLTVVLLIAASVPQAVSLVEPDLYWSVLRVPPELAAAAQQNPVGSYYPWMARIVWPAPSNAVLLNCYPTALRDRSALLMTLALTLAIAGIALQVRAAVRKQPAVAAAEGDDRTKPLAA